MTLGVDHPIRGVEERLRRRSRSGSTTMTARANAWDSVNEADNTFTLPPPHMWPHGMPHEYNIGFPERPLCVLFRERPGDVGPAGRVVSGSPHGHAFLLAAGGRRPDPGGSGGAGGRETAPVHRGNARAAGAESASQGNSRSPRRSAAAALRIRRPVRLLGASGGTGTGRARRSIAGSTRP